MSKPLPDQTGRLTLWHCLICDHNAGGPTCKKCGQPANKLLGFCTLGPCTREGDPEIGDWWREQHTYCTGSHHLGPGEIMLCDCTCHATREDWFKIAHFVHGEPVEEVRGD